MTNDTYNIILDNQVFTYSINDTSNRLHINSEFINTNPEIECKYVHCNSYDSKYNQHFSILHKNARSFIHNIDDVILLLDSIETKFSFIVITETWLQNHNADIYTINNYNAIHTTRINTKGGGISIYIKDNLNFNKIENIFFTEHDFIDIVTINVIINNKKIIISGIYKSPKADIIRFSDLIYNMFSNISAKNYLYLVGDFNINILMDNLTNKYFIDVIYGMGCRPMITRPTRYSYTLNSLIDNIFCNVNCS